MNNNPLQRRMFAQQLMNRHNMANEPMGILASSPQLMNAAQGLANGGMVKGYNRGGGETAEGTAKRFNDRNVSVFMVPSILAQHPNITYNKDLKQFIPISKQTDQEIEVAERTYGSLPGETEGPVIPTKEDDNKDFLKKYGEFSTTKVDDNTDTSSAEDTFENLPIDPFEIGNSKRGVPFTGGSLDGVDAGPGTVINKMNEKGNVVEEKLEKKEDPLVNPYANLSKNIATKIKKANDKLDKATNDPKITDKWAKKVEEIYNRDDKIDLAKIDKLAKEAVGIDDNNYDRDRSTAFWMGMIKGGLATAAGTSSNALTNVAKGLGFGVDSYGKDINAINENEREDRKEYGKLKVDLIKNEESKILAHKTLDLQYASNMTTLEQNASQFASRMDFDKAKEKINNEVKFEAIELSKAEAWNKMAWKSKEYKLQVKQFEASEQKQADYVRLTTQQLQDAWDKSLITDDMKEVMALDEEYINVDPKTGRFKSFTELGKQALVTSKITGLKVTDLNVSGNAHVKLGNVLGVKFLDSNGAVDKTRTKAAGIVWQENFADKWQDIQVKKSSGKLDLETQKLEEERVLQDFAERSGGIYTPLGSTVSPKEKPKYDVNANLITN